MLPMAEAISFSLLVISAPLLTGCSLMARAIADADDDDDVDGAGPGCTALLKSYSLLGACVVGLLSRADAEDAAFNWSRKEMAADGAAAAAPLPPRSSLYFERPASCCSAASVLGA